MLWVGVASGRGLYLGPGLQESVVCGGVQPAGVAVGARSSSLLVMQPFPLVAFPLQ